MKTKQTRMVKLSPQRVAELEAARTENNRQIKAFNRRVDEAIEKARQFGEQAHNEIQAQTEQRDTAECQHCGDSATKQIKIQGATIAVCDDCDESLYERDTATNEIKFHKGTCIPKRDFLLHDYGKVAQVQQRDTATQKLSDCWESYFHRAKRAEAHAERLAEALEYALHCEECLGLAANPEAIKKYRDALAQWQREQK